MINPATLDRYLYVRKTRAWKTRLLYGYGLLSWLLVIYGFSGMMGIDPFFTWFVPPVLGLFTVYHLLSFGTNLCYRQFDVSQHESLREEFWLQHVTPSVDIFLPICGEKISILEHTWRHVAQLAYDNKRVYVLDDSAQHSDKHRAMAERYGFIYLERPNKGEMKKAGNLKYAFQRTDGEFIVIFDADFAPHPDFLRETIPYMSNPRIGIVQTPQYFDIAKDAYRRSPLAYAAAYQEEFFYRIIQVAKDRFDAAICCGSNAVYRRTALQAIGGPRQVTASEDSRTGFALLSKGWVTRYIPLIVAVGICPDNVYAYYHQQHRWCRGRSELVLSKEFRRAPVSLLKKLLNTTGFLAFLLRPLELALTLQLFWMLFLYSDLIPEGTSLVFYPYMAFAFIFFPLAHITRFRKEVFFAAAIQLYANTHSVISVLMGHSVGWISTNAKHTTVSPAFRQTTRIVAAYIIAYLLLLALSIRTGDLHFLDHRYWSIQFWIFWNLTLSAILLWQLYKTADSMHGMRVSGKALALWQAKRVMGYILLITVGFWTILFI